MLDLASCYLTAVRQRVARERMERLKNRKANNRGRS